MSSTRRRTTPQSVRCRGRGLRDRRHLTGHAAAEHADLRAQLLGHEFELGNRFVRGVHRDDRRRRQPVAEAAEVIGRDDIIGADHGAAGRVVLDARQAQTGGRVNDDKIQAELVEAVVEQFRHHRGGAVEGVFRLACPERLLADALLAAFGDRHRQILAGRPHRPQKPVRGEIAADLAHLVAEHRIVFDPMPVAIDDRMVDFRPDLFRGHMRAHDLLRSVAVQHPRLCGRRERRATTDRRRALHLPQGRPSSTPG
jgi:hypothetical protein